MKASQLFKIGEFRTVDVEVPVPHGKELLVKVGACGICGSDIPRIFELGTSKQKYPLTLGHEFGGEIVSVGEDADPGLVGKRGAIFPCIPCRKCDPCLTADYAMCLDYDYPVATVALRSTASFPANGILWNPPIPIFRMMPWAW